MSVSDAMEIAVEAGLDLVEVSPNMSPPVCKILDYGKFKYQAQKKANEARKKTKRPSTSKKSRCVRTSTRMTMT